MIGPNYLGGVGEIADIAGVSKQVVCNWRARYLDFPQPEATLAMGGIYDLRKVWKWLQGRI